jgi:hypothetical protein
MNNIISNYRLGDLINGFLQPYEIANLINEHPDSIGAEYFKEFLSVYDIRKLSDIVQNRINNNLVSLPVDIQNSIVIHLRLGDVVSGNEWHEKAKRPHNIDYYINNLKDSDSYSKIYIIGKPFFAHTSSKNYDECIENSNLYLNSVIGQLKAEYYDGGFADMDLCAAVLSKKFIQGKGHFSKLITDIRRHLGKFNNVETAPQ